MITLLTNVKVISKEIEDKENNQLDILKLTNTIKTTTKKIHKTPPKTSQGNRMTSVAECR